MSAHSDDNIAGTAIDSKMCGECDTFGEDRCSVHGQLSAPPPDHGYTRMVSRYGGACRSCRGSFAKDDIIYWAPERKPLCEACGQGSDPAEIALSALEKDQMSLLLETMAKIEKISKPWTVEIQDQFETTLAALYGQFRKVVRVRTFVERHMEELKSIPARQGMRHSRPLLSRRADVCRICHKHTEKGELIWWSPSEPLMCFDCGRGKDPEEALLSADDRKRLASLLERAKQFDDSGNGGTSEQRAEYDALLVILYSRFRRIVQVKRILLKHMESLKAIAGRKGPGNIRTVISKQDHTCRACSRTIDKGEVVWWSPDEQRLCFDCGQLEETSAPDNQQLRRALELLEQLKRLDDQTPENLPAAWAAKLLDEREDVLIELYCDLRHLDEVRVVLYDHFTELCAIAGRANAG